MLTVGWYLTHIWFLLDMRVRVEFSWLFPSPFQEACSLDSVISHQCLILCSYSIVASYETTTWRICFWKTAPPRIRIRSWARHRSFTKSRLTLRHFEESVQRNPLWSQIVWQKERKRNLLSFFCSLNFLLFDSPNEPRPQDDKNKMFCTCHHIRTNFRKHFPTLGHHFRPR